jgi:hypothetical protein
MTVIATFLRVLIKGILSVLVPLALLGLFVAIVRGGAPAGLPLIAAGFIYLGAKARNGVLFHATCDTLAPLVFGLLIAVVWFWCVRLFTPSVNLVFDCGNAAMSTAGPCSPPAANHFTFFVDDLAFFERWLTRVAIRLEELSNIGPLGYGCILIGLALLGAQIRRSGLVQAGIRIKQSLDFLSTALLTTASFTFFAQLPIEERIRIDRDLEARYRYLPKEIQQKQERSERFLIRQLSRQVNEITPMLAVDFRRLLDDIRDREEIAGYPDFYRRLLLERNYRTDFPTLDMIAFDRIAALSTGQYALPDSAETPPQALSQSSNRELLLAANTSFCNALTEATGKLLGNEKNIAFRFLKSLVELGAEKLIEKDFEPSSNVTTIPLNVRSLFRPEVIAEGGFVAPSPSLATFHGAVTSEMEDWRFFETNSGRPVVFAFGLYARFEEEQIQRTLDTGGDPFERSGRDGYGSKERRAVPEFEHAVK